MLDFLRGKARDRKLRLFAVACCRRIWQLLADERSRRAVETSERYADGLADEKERKAAQVAARAARKAVQAAAWAPDAREAVAWAREEAAGAATAVVVARAEQAAKDVPARAVLAGAWAQAGVGVTRGPPVRIALQVAQKQEWRGLSDLCREVLGNPFRPSPPLPAAVLAWNDGTVRRIGQAIYEERQLPAGTLDPARLAILADALFDAGSDDEELIRHCRSAGPHVRGCWAVDLILGKE
jgi:hypothetical protein